MDNENAPFGEGENQLESPFSDEITEGLNEVAAWMNQDEAFHMMITQMYPDPRSIIS